MLFNEPIVKEGKLGGLRWLSMYIGLFGSYRKNETIDVEYRLDGKTQLASDLPVTPSRTPAKAWARRPGRRSRLLARGSGSSALELGLGQGARLAQLLQALEPADRIVRCRGAATGDAPGAGLRLDASRPPAAPAATMRSSR